MNNKPNVLDDVQAKIILLVESDEIPIKGRLWLQAELFLLSRKVDSLERVASYKAGLGGPYSDIIEAELVQLEEDRVVSMVGNSIALSKRGLEVAKALKEKEDSTVLEYIRRFKDFVNDMSKDELFCYVYLAYPKLCKESVEWKEIESRKEEVILSMVEREKISMGRARELLNVRMEEIISKLNDRNYQVLS